MRLSDLRSCCDEFLVLDPGDRFTVQLRNSTGEHVDPKREDHRRALFLWLRQWGCRQFARRDEVMSHESLLAWWETHGHLLPTPSSPLHELSLDPPPDTVRDVRSQR